MMNVTVFLTLLLLGSLRVKAFAPKRMGSQRVSRPDISLRMGLFDALNKAFSNEQYASPPEGIKATARHILVNTPEDVTTILAQLRGGSTFADMARNFSTCPSARRGGSLGSFRPGTMVAEFDEIIFSPETKLGQVVGPVQTEYGYHLIIVDKRTGV